MTTSRLELLVVPGSNPAAAGRLLGVTFSGDPQSPAQFIPVKTDAGNEFVAPQWRDDNGDGVLTGNDHTYPVAYIRNTKPMVSGKFELKPATVVWIKAGNTDGFETDPIGPLTVPSNGIVNTSATMLKKLLPNKVFHYPAFNLKWESSSDGTNWTEIGQSSNPLYVVNADSKLGLDPTSATNTDLAPNATQMRFSLLHLGCVLATQCL